MAVSAFEPFEIAGFRANELTKPELLEQFRACNIALVGAMLRQDKQRIGRFIFSESALGAELSDRQSHHRTSSSDFTLQEE